MKKRFSLVVVSLASALACSSSSSSQAPPDASNNPCNMLADDSSPTRHMFQIMMGTAPAPTGGTIVDGTYLDTKDVIYSTSPPMPSDGGTAVVVSTPVSISNSGKTWQSASDTADGIPAETKMLAFSGSGGTSTITCPPDVAGTGMNSPTPFQYSASATDFTLYVTTSPGTTFATTFTKQ